jgi:hypothetical protein
MQVTIEPVQDERLKSREDLIQIMKAAAEYLASRDRDPDSQASARWKLWSGADGAVWIGLELRDQGFSRGQQFAPSQLVPADIREHRLIEIWNDVLERRTRRQVDRVNELISQLED